MSRLVVPGLALCFLCSPTLHARPRATAAKPNAAKPGAARPTATRPRVVTKKSKAGRHAERNDDRIRPIGPDTPVLSARKPDRGLRKVGKRPYAARAPSTKLHYQSRDVRLLATLTQNDPQDESTDEIFYKLIAVKADHNVVSHHVASKGEWSMGKKANHFMLHNLFEGTVGRRQDIAFVLVVADNDIGGDWLSGNTIPAEERAADWGLARIRANVPADQRAAVRDQFAANIRQAVHDVLWETGDLIGFTAFAFQGGKLKVIAPTGSWSEVSTANATGASFTLRGLGANYTVRLDVKDAAQPTPRQFNYLSTEDEECDQHTVLMKSETGDVAINRGQVKDVDVIYRNMFWRCGAEQENTKGPANTHYAVVRRKPTGEDMYIFTYSYFPAFAAIDLL